MAAANAVWTGVDSAGFIVGSIAGGILIASLPASTALAATALPYGLAALVLLAIRRDPTPEHRRAVEDVTVREEVLAGFRTIAAVPQLRTLVGTLSAAMLIQGTVDALIVIFGLQTLGLATSEIGVLTAMWGVGGMFGGVAALGLLGRGRLARGLGFGLVIMGTPLLVLSLVDTLPVAVVVFVFVGVGYALVAVAGLTLLQRLASDDVLSRVFGVVESTYVISMGIGAALAPLLVSLLGVRGALLAVGAFLPVLALLRWRTLARFEAGRPIPERPFVLLRGVPLFRRCRWRRSRTSRCGSIPSRSRRPRRSSIRATGAIGSTSSTAARSRCSSTARPAGSSAPASSSGRSRCCTRCRGRPRSARSGRRGCTRSRAPSSSRA